LTTYITTLDEHGSGPRIAVKDLIDVVGVATTAGSRAVADGAVPAAHDASCLAGARAADARMTGKANLFELAYGAYGINEFFGTPVNPLDSSLDPGGSSSGSAVAVATGDAAAGYGTDTGGSVRIPSAFCGITGLKTTHDRVPLGEVWPLAPSVDTVGPIAKDVSGVVAGMALLEPGFTVCSDTATTIGRLRVSHVDVDPRIDQAINEILAWSELEVIEIELTHWRQAYRAGYDIIDWEAVQMNSHLLDDPLLRSRLGRLVLARLTKAQSVSLDRYLAAKEIQKCWIADLDEIFRRVELIALPTVAFFPPPLEKATTIRYTDLTQPFNVAGIPVLAQPVPTSGPLPASMQLAGPAWREELLLATGSVIEAAAF
jgi:amidase